MQDLSDPSQARQAFASIILITAGYTAFLFVATFSIRCLWRTRAVRKTRGQRILLPYTVFLLLIATVLFALGVNETYTSLLDGNATPAPVSSTNCDTASDTAMSAVFELSLLVSDALLVYRTYVISGKKVWLTAVGCVLWMCSLVFGVLMSSLCPVGLEIAWVASNIVLNIFLTVSIVVAVWPARKAPGHAGRRASSIMGILAESAALYTVFGIVFAIGLLAPGNTYVLLGYLYGIAAGLSASIITLRIALGIEYALAGSSASSPILPTSSGQRSASLGSADVPERK